MGDQDCTCPSQGEGWATAQMVISVVTLLMSFLTAVVTGTRMRAKCGCAEFNMKPSSMPPTPPDAYKPLGQQASEKSAVK